MSLQRFIAHSVSLSSLLRCDLYNVESDIKHKIIIIYKSTFSKGPYPLIRCLTQMLGKFIFFWRGLGYLLLSTSTFGLVIGRTCDRSSAVSDAINAFPAVKPYNSSEHMRRYCKTLYHILPEIDRHLKPLPYLS